ncbi:MAG TPA: GNAT family N-acetyltransferase [Deltaproteobacteria bacterium]|nr:GNAT family N-acetyltransferase [Deltaproteobacteria bacterium]HPR56266.1 GNAT family N-acetyltransferase [Deltaproteobacteria bacterium]HXK48098.1 GNAT family N-acetyltransferase [Deltaproteobacteria bacterium]
MMFLNTFPVLTTERLTLRSLERRDLEAVFSVFSDPEVMRYWHTTPMTGIREARTFITDAQKFFSRRTSIRWGVARRSDDLVIGTCVLFHFDEQHRRAEIGYALGHDHWGHGFNHEALKAVLGYAFPAFSLHRIEAELDPRNAASIRTLERCGFVREGVLRERCITAGKISDSLVMGLLAREWNGAAKEAP